MRLRFLFGLVVCLVCGPAHGQSSSTGTLAITSTTAGAEVYVDGEKRGLIPLPGPISLSPGQHTIKVLKPGFAPLIDVFTIHKRKPTVVEAELVPVAGVLIVAANVEKAHVFIDGKFIGEAPLTTEMPVGPRAIQVSKGGYKDFFQNISSVAGQDVLLDIKLDELPPEINPYKQTAPPPAKWYEKWWVWTAAAGGVAVVLSVTLAVVFTRPGDPCANNPLACYTVVLSK